MTDPSALRRMLVATISAFALAGCGEVFLDGDGHGGAPGFGDTEQREVVTEQAVVPIDRAWRGVVDRVIDGDTVWVEVTDPNGQPVARGEIRKLRLLRIDTPEVGRDGAASECLADEATRALTRLTPRGATVHAVYDVEHQDRFGRDLVHLVTDDGTWVNEAMLADGFANVVTFPPNTAYTDEVRRAERYARDNQLGLWDPDACA